MTEDAREAALAAGWHGEELEQYLKGREEAAARIAALPVEPWVLSAPPPALVPGTPEYQAARMEEASAARNRATVAERQGRPPAITWTERPGMPPNRSEELRRARRNALQWCIDNNPPVTRPGSEPLADQVRIRPDGEPEVVHKQPVTAQIQMLSVRPEHWEAHLAAREYTQRRKWDEFMIETCELFGLDDPRKAEWWTA